MIVLQDYLKKLKDYKRAAGLTEHGRVSIAKMCIKLGLKGKTIEHAAAAFRISQDHLFTALQEKAPDIHLLSIITDKELLIIREYLEKDAGAKRLEQKAKIRAHREEQLKSNPRSRKRRKKKNQHDELPKLKIIFTPHPKH